MVNIDVVTNPLNSIADKITGIFISEEDLAMAEAPSTADQRKVAFVRDAVRVIVTACAVVAVTAVAYYVAKKTGALSWIKGKIGW